jgi:hypothetical protein
MRSMSSKGWGFSEGVDNFQPVFIGAGLYFIVAGLQPVSLDASQKEKKVCI